MVTSGWAQDAWSSALLPHHQPIRRKSHTLKRSPQILPIKDFSLKTTGEFGSFEHKPPVLLAWRCSKPFSAPYANILVCWPSLCIRHMKLRLITQDIFRAVTFPYDTIMVDTCPYVWTHRMYSKSLTYKRAPSQEHVHKSNLFISPTKLA